MKILLKISSTAMIAVGIICIMLCGGEDSRPLGEWLLIHGSLAAMGSGAFIVAGMIDGHMEDSDKQP